MKLLTVLATSMAIAGAVATHAAETPKPSGPGSDVLHSGIYVAHGNYTSKRARVLDSREDYEAYLSQYSDEAPVDVDFSENVVLLVDMGQRNTGGYSIQVGHVERQGDDAVAHVTLTKPGPTCVITGAVTNPYQFVRVPTQGDVLLKETINVSNCVGPR